MATKTIAEIEAARVEALTAKSPNLSETDALILSRSKLCYPVFSDAHHDRLIDIVFEITTSVDADYDPELVKTIETWWDYSYSGRLEKVVDETLKRSAV